MRTVSLCCVFLSLLNVGRAEDSAAEPAQKIVWETNIREAFVKALEDVQPLVVLFASNPEYRNGEGKNLSNQQLKEFDDPAVQSLAKHAVFAICIYDHSTDSVPNEDARKVFDSLKIEIVPTLSVIANRTDTLTELYRKEGVHSAAQIVSGLSPYFVQGKSASDNQSATAAAAAVRGAPETPSDAVHQLSRTVRVGDIDWLPTLLTKEYAESYRKVITASWQLGSAKRRLLAAMDQQFGLADDEIPYGDDDVELRDDLKKLGLIVFEQASYPEPTLALVQVRCERPNKPAQILELRVVLEDKAWKIEPPEMLMFTDPARCQHHVDSLNNLAIDYFALAKQVLKGEYESREKCRQATLELYRQRQSAEAQ